MEILPSMKGLKKAMVGLSALLALRLLDTHTRAASAAGIAPVGDGAGQEFEVKGTVRRAGTLDDFELRQDLSG